MKNLTRKKLIILRGPMGIGKTTVGEALLKQLPAAAYLDGDWCWNIHLFQVTEETKRMVMGNICHVLNSFLRCSAFENVVFCWVLHEQSILDELLGQLDTDGWQVQAVSLVCGEAALRRRLEGDIAAGVRTPDVIGRSLARLPLYRALSTVKIDTTAEILKAQMERP